MIDPDSRTIISEESREQNNNDELLEPMPIDQRLPIEQRGASVVVSSNDNGSSSQTRNYEVTRTREVYEKTQGEIKNLTASVLLNYKKVTEAGPEGEELVTYEPYPETEVEEFREVVMLALGLQEERGDQLTIKQVEFFDREFMDNGEYFMDQPNYMNDVLRWSLIGLTFLAVLFLINSIRKKFAPQDLKTMSEFKADPSIEGGEQAASLTGDSEEGQEEGMLEGAAKSPKKLKPKQYDKEEIMNFIEIKPAEAAQVMRALIASDKD